MVNSLAASDRLLPELVMLTLFFARVWIFDGFPVCSAYRPGRSDRLECAIVFYWEVGTNHGNLYGCDFKRTKVVWLAVLVDQH